MTRPAHALLALAAVSLALLAGCDDFARAPASKPHARAKSSKPAPVIPYKLQVNLSAPAMALLDACDDQADKGDLDAALATLERAIRIQPKSAYLWYRMGELRLHRGDAELAAELARKSISLAREDRKLLQSNWAMIAEARKRLGDAPGAAEALGHLGDEPD